MGKLIVASRSDYPASEGISAGIAQLGLPCYRAGCPEELEALAQAGDCVVFAFWSWKIPDKILLEANCISFHPSDLPKFRGGSPIQNQILAGLKETKLSAFRPNSEIDGGDVYLKEPLSLEGDLAEIHWRIAGLIPRMVQRILVEKSRPVPQDESNEPPMKRRTPEQSEVFPDRMTAQEAYDLVRCLNMPPYPAAFITCKDGGKLYIKKAEL